MHSNKINKNKNKNRNYVGCMYIFKKIEETARPQTWSNCDARTFEVRKGPSYVSGQKQPSEPALYKVFAMDAYKTIKKVKQFHRFMNLEPYIKEHGMPYHRQLQPLPAIICINFMLPGFVCLCLIYVIIQSNN